MLMVMTLAQRGQILVQLRKNGYILDDYFLDYWEVMGSRLPEENTLGVDYYLIHELHRTDTNVI